MKYKKKKKLKKIGKYINFKIKKIYDLKLNNMYIKIN